MHRLSSLSVASFVTSLSLLLSFPLSEAQAKAPSNNNEVSVVSGAASRELVVGLRSISRGAERNVLDALERVGEVRRLSPALCAAVVRVKPGANLATVATELRRQPGVAYVEANHVLHACSDPNDPSYATLQYAPQKIQADLSWDIWQPVNQVVVAIIDTGIESTHPDLKNVICRDANGVPIAYNAITGAATAEDDSGHGTHCAGIVGAQINNSTGVAGLAGWNPDVPGSGTFIKLMPVKALDAAGNGTDATIANGIVWAADHGAHVLCISSATATASTTLNNAVQYAWNKGCVIVAGAGNDASTALRYPAAYDHVISVAATDETDTLWEFSNYGSWIKVAAPGSNIYSTYKSASYMPLTGTSSAAPHVAAEAAAIFAQNSTFNNADVEHVIVSQVDPVLPIQGRAPARGVGRINFHQALKAAGTGLPVVTAVSLQPAEIANQTNSLGSVQLGGPAPAGGRVVSLTSSNTAVATVPASVTVPAGATYASFTAAGEYVSSLSRTVITASTPAESAQATLTVYGPVAQSISILPSAVTGGLDATGTVTLDTPAPAAGATVVLASDTPSLASAPSTVTIAAGQRSSTFTIGTGTVSRRTSLQVSASYGGETTTTTLVLNPIQASQVTVSPASILGGNAVTGKVTLNGPAPAAGAKVTLTSSLTTAATVPASVTVPGGQTSATFTISTLKVAASKSVTITATYTTSVKATLKVVPLLKAVALSPTSATGGTAVKGTVTLNEPAPAGGAVVALSSNSTAATAPASVTVLAGATTATFDIATKAVATSTVATITATNAGAPVTVKLTVKPAVPSRLTLSPTSVQGGASSTGTVTLTGPAPAGGFVVALSSNNAQATVPASLTIPAGASAASFPVSTSTVTVKLSATISATGGGVTKSATLTLNP